MLIGLDIFAGAGGLSLGAKWSGIQIDTAIEINKHAAATYAHNHQNVKLLIGDIRSVFKVNLNAGKAQTIAFGGPPCKGFSTSNQRTRNRENPSNLLYREYLRIVALVKPDWVVFENVRGILETEGGLFVKSIIGQLSKLGYILSEGVLNAADFGVPQNRYRYFIIGSRHGIKVNLPERVVKRPITVKEALYDLPKLANGALFDDLPYRQRKPSNYAKQLRTGNGRCGNHLVSRNNPTIIERFSYIPQGGNWEDIPVRLMKNYADRSRCHTGIYHRLAPDEPSKVIGNYRKNMMIHPYENRGLSVREAARLQSFPDSFEFKGSIGFQQEQVGNAVPPLLAKALFQVILEAAT